MNSEFNYRRNYQGPIQAVIFDWAGTIVDFGSCAPAIAFLELFHRKGIKITTSQARAPMGLEKKRHIQTLLEMEELSESFRAKFGRGWSKSDVDEFYCDFLPIQIETLKAHSRVIPGVIEAMDFLRSMQIKIGTTTGYSSDMISIVAKEAEKQGLVPDTIVCPSDSMQGRPAPWMAFECMKRLQVYPAESCVKIGDTQADIDEGLNAGMWTVAVSKTGNELGLSEAELKNLNPTDCNRRLDLARSRLLKAGAHFVINGVDELKPIVDEIQKRIRLGEKP